MSTQKEIVQKAFGIHLKRLREQKGLTQIDVASRMNKDQQSLQRIESGNVSPSLYYLYELAKAFDLPLRDLMTFELKKSKKK